MIKLKPRDIPGFTWKWRISRQKEHWYKGVGGRKNQSVSEELQEGQRGNKPGDLRDRQFGVQ